jgi:ParB-like chromosome segregation protein Spo0J
MIAIADLKPYDRNARTHSDAQIDQIVASLREFGWTNPILTDGIGGVIAGHARLEAAKRLGLTDVPCIDLSGLSEAQKRAYILADNKLALNAGWDEKLLALEFGDLKALDFNLDLTGFDAAEIRDFIEGTEIIQPEYDETTADSVAILTCPYCGKTFPR